MARIRFAMTCTALLTTLGATTAAHALDQSKHQSISKTSCAKAGLPSAFCARVGAEAYNVDSYEWNDMAAHAQVDAGQTTCEGANAALDRVLTIGGDIRATLDQLDGSSSSTDSEHIAVQLGRVLHTVQDECAHHGMPNKQHAWWSLSDTCDGTSYSPDVQSDALSCAVTETDAVFAAFTQSMADAHVARGQLAHVPSSSTHWPARGDVCAFLKSARTWDGSEGRWDRTVMTPQLTDQLVSALTIDDEYLGDPCEAGDAISLNAPLVDTSHPRSFCFKISVYCLGKADAADAPPPWDDGSGDEAAAAPAADGASMAGCAIATTGAHGGSPVGTGALGLLAVGGILALGARRRR